MSRFLAIPPCLETCYIASCPLKGVNTQMFNTYETDIEDESISEAKALL